MNVKLQMTDLNVFHKASQDSGDSGIQLMEEVKALRDAVEVLKSSFKGAGATAYSNFMVQVDECQNTLAEALGMINTGQAEVYRSYAEGEDTMVDQAQAKSTDDFPMSRGSGGPQLA